MPVKVIKASKKIEGTAALKEEQVLRVAAYCRVSTDSEEQESSYEVQCSHYSRYIEEQDGWELAGIYADEGISGTGTKRRTQFNQLIKDCDAGLIDMVITKSISRFARNTVDCLLAIRKLKASGIAIYFEKENINTLDAKGEVLITIMASIAQQESQSISQNVSLGIQQGFEEGRFRFNYTQFMGYTRDEETREMKIIPADAKLVRRIFREYLDGYSPGLIAHRLTEEGIKTPTGRDTWYQSTITSMLENEKYAGDVLMQKYFVEDFLTHKIVKNEGQKPQYYIENEHEPIVPREVFFQVQGEMQRRSLLKGEPNKLRFGAASAFAGRLICGLCGRTLKRYHNSKAGILDWRCRKRSYQLKDAPRERSDQCPCRRMPDDVMKTVMLEVLNGLPQYRDELIRMQGAVWKGDLFRIDELMRNSKEQEKRLTERITDLTGPEESNQEIAFLTSEVLRLREEQNALILERAEAAHQEMHIRTLLELVDIMSNPKIAAELGEDGKPASCSDYEDFFRRTAYQLPDSLFDETGRLVRFDDALVIRYLDHIMVHDDRLEVRFKAGITIVVK